MAVAVEGDGDAAVAEAFLDGLGVGAESDAEGGAGVAEVVKSHLGWEAGRCEGGLEVSAVEVLVVEGRALG